MLARVAITLAYVVVFWLCLPIVLYLAGGSIDCHFGLSTPPRLFVGVPVFFGGLGFVAWAMAQLWREGGGPPISALPPPSLAAAGPYRWVRHPIYLGFNVAVVGSGLLIGSPGLTWGVGLLFLPAWMIYARIEERGLRRRFGSRYSRFCREVGLLPRFPLLTIARIAMRLGLLRVRVEGREHIPTRGAFLVAANHSSYLDCVLIGHAVRREIRFLVTAEAFRSRVLGWIVRQFRGIPLRRYRPDPAGCREMLRVLTEGWPVCVFPAGERSVLGNRLPSLPSSARALSRLPWPVIPAGLSGAYDIGPRWSGVLRRRPALVRFGPPIRWGDEVPHRRLDCEIAALLVRDPAPVTMAGIPRARLAAVLWRCPRCGSEEAWNPAALDCTACRANWRETPSGCFVDSAGVESTLADLGMLAAEYDEVLPFSAASIMRLERDVFGRIRPLTRATAGTLEIGTTALRLGDLELPYKEIRVCNTERNDTLQVATAGAMWQFSPIDESPFRLQRAIERRCEAAR